MPQHVINLNGLRFGKWTVLFMVDERARTPKGQTRLLWWCKCDCGKVSQVAGRGLRSGESRSCTQCRQRPPSPPRVCLAPNCGRRGHARGKYCAAHARRLQRAALATLTDPVGVKQASQEPHVDPKGRFVVTSHYFDRHPGQIANTAASGKRCIVTRRGLPIVAIVPLRKSARCSP